MISARDIRLVFHPGTVLETHALRGVSLEVPTGEFVTVIGSNGAGKSTLLGVLSGEVPPTSGTVLIDGADVTRQPVHDRAHHAARVFQDPLAGTCASLTIEENLALAQKRGTRRGLGLAVNKTNREIFADRIKVLGLGLEDRLGDRIGRLSGGQRQAVSLIMATLADSRILLLDEHTAALDPRMAAFVIDLTNRVYEEFALTILMVTHSMKDALSCGGRTVMLHQGEVVLDVAGESRAGMSVGDLMDMFTSVRGEALADDSLLLS